MKMNIDVPDYSPEHGFPIQWDEEFEIVARIESGTVLIQANQAGLVSLARLLLTLSQRNVPSGQHVHLDDSNSLEDGSCELIIDKL
jgi:hypothetical protein